MCLFYWIIVIQKMSQKLEEHCFYCRKRNSREICLGPSTTVVQFVPLLSQGSIGNRNPVLASLVQLNALSQSLRERSPFLSHRYDCLAKLFSVEFCSTRGGRLFLIYLLKWSQNHTKVSYRIVAGPEYINSNKFGNRKSYL